MYLAELRGKLSRDLSKSKSENQKVNFEEAEDILTSNVFGFLKYADRQVYLGAFLRELQLELPAKDLQEAEFQFWPTYPDGTEPDVVIIAGKYYILVEAKKNANFGTSSEENKKQLHREHVGGSKAAFDLEKEFILLTITSDYSFKLSKFEETPEIVSLSCFKWTSWQKFASLLERILDKNEEVPNRLFADDLLALLERKNLREFRSFHNLKYPYQYTERIFFSYATAKFRGAFIGFESALPNYTDEERANPIFYEKNFFSGLKGMPTILKPVETGIFYRREKQI